MVTTTSIFLLPGVFLNSEISGPNQSLSSPTVQTEIVPDGSPEDFFELDLRYRNPPISPNIRTTADIIRMSFLGDIRYRLILDFRQNTLLLGKYFLRIILLYIREFDFLSLPILLLFP